MIELWLKHFGTHWLFPLTFAVLMPVLVRAVFSLHRSRSQDRKDFLDLWMKRDQADGLWLQVAVRHVYGQHLPMPMLRHLISLPQGGRALVEISEVWPLIDWDESVGELHWRQPRHSTHQGLMRDYRYSLFGYFVAAAVSMIGTWIVMAGHSESGWVEWTYLVAGWGATFYFLARQERLNTARVAVPRWLVGMDWRGGSCSQADDAVRSDAKSSRHRGARLLKECASSRRNDG